MLKYFFVAYRESTGPRWGSRFMKAVGTLFLGSPEKKGLGHLREDIQEQFYYCKEDRILPPPEQLEEWRNHAILANEYRQEELPACAKAVYRVNGALSILVVCLAAAIGTTSSTSESEASAQSMVGGLLGSAVPAATAPSPRWRQPIFTPKAASAASNDPECHQIAALRSALSAEDVAAYRVSHPHCF